VLLDLTAAFDTVGQSIILSRLNHYVGIKGTAFQWFSSYLTNRTFFVVIGNLSSSLLWGATGLYSRTSFIFALFSNAFAYESNKYRYNYALMTLNYG